METEMQIQSQIVDDVPLIIEMTKQMNLCELINTFFPSHGNQQGIDNGKLFIGWLAFIISQNNHCKNGVREWSNKISYILEPLLEVKLREVEFSDDRLANLLDYLSDDNAWNAFEDSFSKNVIEVYELPVETIRCDGSAACGYHEVKDEGIMQYGRSKDHRPDLPQLKIMAASLDPGILIGMDVLSGEKNDDPLYVPLIKRIRPIINKSGVLFVGDCKMSALNIRADIEKNKDLYLAPLGLSNTKIRKDYKEFVKAVTEGSQQAELVYKTDEKTRKTKLIACGYELIRKQECIEEKIVWNERVFVYRSLEFARSEIALFEKKLHKIELELLALTPITKKGSRQIYNESKLQEGIKKILNKSEIGGLISIQYHKEEYNKKERFVIVIKRKDEEVEKYKNKCGWRLMVTNATEEKLTFNQAILTYRQEWTLERCFKILKKSHLGISPLYVRKESRLKGLVRLLSVAVRFMVLLEYAIAKSLKDEGETIKGLDIAHPNKEVKTPTAYSILRKFCREKIILTKVDIGEKIFYKMTNINEDLRKILRHLKIPLNVYRGDYYQIGSVI